MKVKVPLVEDVYEITLSRIHRLYELVDRVVVMFSGGKDSTIALHCTLEVARVLNLLPLEVVFYDEEVIPPETVEYVRRVANMPDINLRWICAPVKHRNGCSRQHPYWYPWNPDKRELWVRDPPDDAEHLPSAFGLTMRESDALIYKQTNGIHGVVFGIRAQESLRRMQTVIKKVHDNYLFTTDPSWITRAYVIYDWRTEDVWTAPAKFEWDYNRAYDTMSFVGLTPHDQRVGPPYGEEPLAKFWTYAVCWPEMWDKMLVRVDGAPAAARYARTSLYGNQGVVVYDDPVAEIEQALSRWPDETAEIIRKQIRENIRTHYLKTDKPISNTDGGETGVTWKYLLMKAKRGDLKSRRKAQVPTYELDWMKTYDS